MSLICCSTPISHRVRHRLHVVGGSLTDCLYHLHAHLLLFVIEALKKFGCVWVCLCNGLCVCVSEQSKIQDITQMSIGPHSSTVAWSLSEWPKILSWSQDNSASTLMWTLKHWKRILLWNISNCDSQQQGSDHQTCSDLLHRRLSHSTHNIANQHVQHTGSW